MAPGLGLRLRRSLRYRAIVLAATLLLAAAFRLAVLGQRQLIEGDGVHYASLARIARTGGGGGVSNPYWSNLWPGVIAAASVVTGLDVEGAGRLASLVSGLLVVVLAVRLAFELFGARAAAVAGVAAAIHPWLVQFSTLVFTEAFFSCLLLSVLLLALRLARRPSAAGAVSLGVAAGAAVITRPEALGFTLVALVFVFAAVRARGVPVGRAAGLAACVLVVVVAFMGVRTLAVHRYYERWDFATGVKGTANLLIGLAPTDADRERLIRGTGENDGSDLRARLQEMTLVGFVWAHPGIFFGHVGRNLVLLAGCLWRVLPALPVAMGRPAFAGTPLWTVIDVANAFCLLLGAYGLWRGLRAKRTRPGTSFVAGLIGVQCLGLAPFVVHDRMVVTAAPLFLLLFANGVAVSSRGRIGRLRAAGGLALFALVTAYGLWRTEWSDYASEQPALKQAGLWLREHCDRRLRLMTASPHIAFYFYDVDHADNEIVFPYATYPILMQRIRLEGADLVAAPAWHLAAGGFPAAPQLTPEGHHPGLRLLATVGVPPAQVHIFRVETEAKTGEEAAGEEPPVV